MLSIRPNLNITTDGVIDDEWANKIRKLEFMINEISFSNKKLIKQIKMTILYRFI
jgi:hypothetical protein